MCLKVLLRNEANAKSRGLKYEFTEVGTKPIRKPSIKSVLWEKKDIVNCVGSWYELSVPFCCFSWHHCNQTQATTHFKEYNGLIFSSVPCLRCGSLSFILHTAFLSHSLVLHFSTDENLFSLVKNLVLKGFLFHMHTHLYLCVQMHRRGRVYRGQKTTCLLW